MKGIIIYTSKYNTTREYAQWISEETDYATVSLKDLSIKNLKDYNVVIIGSPVMAHMPKLSRWIEKNWNCLKKKKLYLYTTSGAPSSDPGLIKGFESSLPEELSNEITYYPFSGRMIYSKLTFMDKLLMKIGQMMEKDPRIKEEMIKDVDGVKRDEIYGLVNDLKEYIKGSKKPRKKLCDIC